MSLWDKTIHQLKRLSCGALLKKSFLLSIFLVGLKFILIYTLNKLHLLEVQPINLRHE